MRAFPETPQPPKPRTSSSDLTKSTTSPMAWPSTLPYHRTAKIKGMAQRESRFTMTYCTASREMSNGSDPYSSSTGFVLSNNSVPPGVIRSIGIRHNTVAVETGNQGNVSGFGNQADRTLIQYFQGFAITDNVAPASWSVSGTSPITKGINGQFGHANTYAVNSCQRYFTIEAPDGNIPADGTQNFTFAGLPGGGTNYLVSFNGKWTAITSP